ncbi:MAG: hypothetical protein ACE5D6_00210 [Candidatus Zixiibacteriota bacterium]
MVCIILMAGLFPGISYASSKGNGDSHRGSDYESEGMSAAESESKDVSVTGEIRFSDYYSMKGKKCSAFLMSSDGGIICVLDNMKSARIKNELSGTSGKVKVMGSMKTDGKGGRFLEVEEYEVMKSKKASKGSGTEHPASEHPSKWSGERKGSY